MRERRRRRKQAAGGVAERLARAWHEVYLEERRRLGSTPDLDPLTVEWGDLPDGVRSAGCDRAVHVGAKLAALGYALVLVEGGAPEPAVLTDAEVDLMAQMEHDRWVEQRRRAGWSLGPHDARAKTNPNMVPWQQLAPEAREHLRLSERALPAVLVRARLRVVRRSDQ